MFYFFAHFSFILLVTNIYNHYSNTPNPTRYQHYAARHNGRDETASFYSAGKCIRKQQSLNTLPHGPRSGAGDYEKKDNATKSGLKTKAEHIFRFHLPAFHHSGRHFHVLPHLHRTAYCSAHFNLAANIRVAAIGARQCYAGL